MIFIDWLLKLLHSWFQAIKCSQTFQSYVVCIDEKVEINKLENEPDFMHYGFILIMLCGFLSMIYYHFGNYAEKLTNYREDSEIENLNELLENMSSDNDRLTIQCVEMKAQLKKERIQIRDLKFEIDRLQRTNRISIFCPKVRRIHQKYEKILRTDYDSLLPKIIANIDRLIQSQPESNEDLIMMVVKVLNFKKGIDEYLRKVNEDYWRIERNPCILMENLGNEEVEMFPSDEFMENIRKLMADNNFDII